MTSRNAEPLLSVRQMYAADAHAVAHGVSGEVLMEAAGRGAARAIMDRWTAMPCVVLCGPGNNGGDGYVIARHLSAAGWPVAAGISNWSKGLPPVGAPANTASGTPEAPAGAVSN